MDLQGTGMCIKCRVYISTEYAVDVECTVQMYNVEQRLCLRSVWWESSALSIFRRWNSLTLKLANTSSSSVFSLFNLLLFFLIASILLFPCLHLPQSFVTPSSHPSQLFSPPYQALSTWAEAEASLEEGWEGSRVEGETGGKRKVPWPAQVSSSLRSPRGQLLLLSRWNARHSTFCIIRVTMLTSNADLNMQRFFPKPNGVTFSTVWSLPCSIVRGEYNCCCFSYPMHQ